MPNNVLSKAKQLINKLLRTSGNILRSYGYDITDAEIENKSGQVGAWYTYKTKLDGVETNLRIRLTATNVGEVFKSTVDQINSLKWAEDGEYRSTESLFEYLTGIKIDPESDKNDISLENIKKVGKGLLGVPLDKINSLEEIPTDEGSSQWKTFAFTKLVYSLDCETDIDDRGSVTNQKLGECVKWIHKYIDIISKEHREANKQLTHEEKLAREADKKETISNAQQAFSLVKGILVNIQEQLRQLYQDKLNEDLSLDKLIAQPESNSQEESNEDNAFENTANSEEANTEESNVQETSEEVDNVNNSKHINIKLQKIQGSEDIDILALKSNYLPGETLNDVDDIINQDEFFNQLTEEPQSFDIAIDDNGFDIEPCNEFVSCPVDGLNQLFMYGITFYRNLYILHWMAKGNDMMKTHLLSEEMYEELIKEIDTLGELLVEKTGKVLDLGFQCDYLQIKDYEFQESLNILSIYIQTYIDYIDLAYCNQDSDVQSVFDEWLRYWKKQLNYFVKGQEI